MPQLTSSFAIANGLDRETASPFDQKRIQHSFLHFPSEIRNAIYSAVIQDDEGVWIISPPFS
ncbi:hypothetical protein Slin15195_G060720 [Septoria linicola]|uniref:Uncharacterized protein n=1 Tax=Septoria linicola TaxID=215465 RepID=A0A9Q9AVA4_9PEZI|nr:hypothetical protein Slin15195_G060720 [Septoria linicola]